jgi:AraC-like DNA-binding protein
MLSAMRVEKEVYLRSAGDQRGMGVRPVFQDFHILRMIGTYDYPSHQHANYEVILVDRGPYRCSLNGEKIELGKNEVLVIKPGDRHCDHLHDGQCHYVLHFELTHPVAPIRLFAENVMAGDQVCTVPMPEEIATFKALEEESRESDSYSAGIQDAMMEGFFWRLVRHLPPQALSPQFRRASEEQEFTGRLYRLFEEHVQESVTVEQMAKWLNISKRSLSMKCRELLSDSPAQLFTRLKVQKAAQLLVHTDRPVKEISYELGFENPYHFSRVFKRIYGTSPSTLR